MIFRLSLWIQLFSWMYWLRKSYLPMWGNLWISWKISYNEIFKVKELNADWNKCLEENSAILGRCSYDCNGNINCVADCYDEFNQRQQQCPCEVNHAVFHVPKCLFVFRKTALVDVRVTIILALRQLRPQMWLRHQRHHNQKQRLLQQQMRYLYWAQEITLTSQL